MKRDRLSGVIALTLLAAPLACAAPQAPATVDAPAPASATTPATARTAATELMAATSAAVKEIQGALDGKGTLAGKLDQLTSFRHTPDTAARLNAIFGSERPWTLEQTGPARYRWSVQPLRYATPGGGLLEWSDFPLDLTLDKSGKQLGFDGTWASISFEDESARILMRDATLSGTQRKGSGLFWLGTMQGNIASIALDIRKPQPASITLRDVWMRSSVQERPKTVEYAQSFGIKALEAAGHQIDDLVFSYRIANLDKAALSALYQAGQKLDAQQKATPAELEAVLPLLRQFARTASKNKTALRIDEISASYRGQKAALSGSVGMAGVTEADLKDFARFVKRIDARFELRVPVALLREVATTLAQQQAKAMTAQGGAAPDIAKTAQDMTDAMVGKVIGNGFARLENGMLVAPITVRGGVLRVNGKVVELPKKPAPQQNEQQNEQQRRQPPASLHTFMQARRIGDSCTLPDYPAAVLERDAPLTLTLQFTVDAGGGLRDTRLAQASGYPEYDSALLNAFNGCRFVPALRDGKPVEHSDSFRLVREPGSVRP